MYSHTRQRPMGFYNVGADANRIAPFCFRTAQIAYLVKR
jgi:hypothetical protein